MFELVSVNKIYKSKRGTSCHALKDVTLTLGESGLYFLLGKSGSGKSTLLNLLGGLDKPTSGEIYYDGKSFSSFKERDLEAYRNNVVGFVFQEYNLIENMDVYSNVALALNLQSNKDKEAKLAAVRAALSTVELEGYEGRLVGELSGGQQQRVAIARAIVKESSVILADEPTGNLDSETGEEIFSILKKLSKEKLVIIVSHDRENAERYADEIIEIKDGVATARGRVALLQKRKEFTPLQRAKLPFSFKLGFAFNTLLKKKLKSLLTLLSIFFMLIFVCGMHVFYTVNANRSIAVSAQNLGITRFSMKQLDSITMGLPVYKDIQDYGAYKRAGELTGVKSLTGYKNTFKYISGGGAITLLYFNESDNTSWTLSTPAEGAAYLIDSERDLLNLGLSLYEGAEEQQGGVYLADIYIKLLYYKGFKLESDPNYYNQIDELILDYTRFGGNVLTNKAGKQIKINGVIQSGLDPLFRQSNKGATFELPRALTLAEQADFQILCASSFMTEQTYLTYYAPQFSAFDLQLLEKISASIGYGEHEISTLLPSAYVPAGLWSSLYTFAVATPAGVVDPNDLSLTENQIVLPINTYNQLFPDDAISLPQTEYGDRTAWEGITVKHLGENLNIEVNCLGVDKNLLAEETYTLAGVILTDYDLHYKDTFLSVYVKDISETSFIPDLALYTFDSTILTSYTDGEALLTGLNGLQKEFDLRIVDSDSFASKFYLLESTLKETGNVFLLLFILSMLVSVLLLVNLISFSVSARKKEIGILKALGTSNRDLKKIFLIETLLLGGISLLVGGISSIWLLDYANTLVTFFSPGMIFLIATPTTYLLMGIMTLLVLPTLALIPLKQITRLNPIDAIKR